MLSTLLFIIVWNFKVKNKMASQKWGQKDSGQYSVYNPPTSNLGFIKN